MKMVLELSHGLQLKQYNINFSADKYSDLKINSHDNIGNGIFGAVFKGTWKKSPCAAKLLTPLAQELVTGGNFKTTNKVQSAALESLRKESDFLKTLKHDNIVHYIATVIEPKSKLPIIVMELMDCSLKEYLEGRISSGETLSIHCQLRLCFDISKGLAYLHQQEIIHRDLCDDNVLLNLRGGDAKAKIADFGMSRILRFDCIDTTLTGLAHREVYIPPEARDDPYHYSYNLDVYSFGVIAAQIVRLKIHLKKKPETTIFEKISDTHPLKSMICSCLTERRETRPQAAEIVKQLDSMQNCDQAEKPLVLLIEV